MTIKNNFKDCYNYDNITTPLLERYNNYLSDKMTLKQQLKRYQVLSNILYRLRFRIGIISTIK